MHASGSGLVLNGAASQQDRRRDAPRPEDAPVDGRSLADLLAFSSGYGRLITFYDLDDRPAGDWTVFFLSDPSIALATLTALDLPSIEDRLMRELRLLQSLSHPNRHLERLNRIVTVLLRLMRMLDDSDKSFWRVHRTLGRTIRQEIAGTLARPLLPLATHLATTEPESGFRFDLAGLSEHWGLRPVPARGTPAGALGRGWFNHLIPLLEGFVEALLAVLHRVKLDAQAELAVSLEQDGHAPQAALYIAFAQLFRHAQHAVNSFSRRLVGFYYRSILQQDSRSAAADRLYLTFTTAKGVPCGSVPEATLFPAGTDAAGQAIDYAADQPVEVHALAVAALKTLRVVDGTVIVGDDDADALSGPAGLLRGTAALSGKAPAIASPFPLFGATETGTSGSLVTSAAQLGFAVSDDVMMLTSGTRTVELVLRIAASSMMAVMPALEAIDGKTGGAGPLWLLGQILQNSFAYRYSTGGGWMAIDGVTVTAPDASPSATVSTDEEADYRLSFTLTAGAAPFVALSAAPATKDAIPPSDELPAPMADTPTLLAVFAQDAIAVGPPGNTVLIRPYAIVSLLSLSGLAITVDATGFDALRLSGPNGPLDASTPFSPFGTPAVMGATLDIAADELFVKRLDGLDLGIAWYGLPQTSTGFQGYYQGYVVDPDGVKVPPGTLFDNLVFQVALSVENPGLWTLIDTAPFPASPDVRGPDAAFSHVASPDEGNAAYLFRTAARTAVPDAGAPVLPLTGFDDLPVQPSEPPPAYDASASAIRVTLSSPSYGFGDVLYASNVMAASLGEMTAASACAEDCARRCAPAAEVAAASSQLDGLQSANAGSSDDTYTDTVNAAVEQAVSGLTGAALKAVNDGLATLDPTTADRLRTGLMSALSRTSTGGGKSFWKKLSRNGNGNGDGSQPSAATVCANLQSWIDANAGSLPVSAADGIERARTLLAAARQVLSAQSSTSGQPPGIARPVMEASILSAKSSLTRYHSDKLQTCVASCPGAEPASAYPNQPWQPTASAVTLNYGASDVLPGGLDGTFHHLQPFGGTQAVAWPPGGTVPLLGGMDRQGALFIGLDGVAGGSSPSLTLLFQLNPGDGGWSDGTPPVCWSEATVAGQCALTPPDGLEGDTTDGMRQTGIVTLGVAGLTLSDDGLAWLCLSVAEEADRFPRLAGLTPNALTASWVGPGGADTLDTPLPAGTITGSSPVLSDIATIDQPMASFGGRSKATGPAFDMWMAERLRHKNRGIQDWDYGRLVLADCPSVWQVAVIGPGDGTGDGTDDGRDRPPPGHLRVILVAGRDMPDCGDATVPQAGPTVLAEVGDMLAARVSPFITLSVENPPYVRIAVTASVVFRDTDTPAALSARLGDDLVSWLSPWPPQRGTSASDDSRRPDLDIRPPGYWTEMAIAEFIRRRPYVVAVSSLSLSYDPPDGPDRCHYLTSAASHAISGHTVRAARPATAGLPALPAPVRRLGSGPDGGRTA
ncbi:hypothetical protein EI613_17175 [Azospirillum sp. 412522]|nr:hypothetical protein [Azospirillum sp. 412522]MBY6263632.1 hypothetical protein [Azospirillum sp. 412522]